MSVTSVGGSAWSPTRTLAPPSTPTATADDFASLVARHRFRPHDPANQYLTDADRATIREVTGVDVRADGDIGTPVPMDPTTYGPVLDAVGRIAADRASGTLTGPLGADYLNRALHPDGVHASVSTTTASISGASTTAAPAARTQWSSDPRIDEAGWQALDRLTVSDRALVKAATGQDVPTRDSGRPPVVPILAFQISQDREDGVLTGGRDVDAAYLAELARRYDGRVNPFGDALDLATRYLAGTASTDGHPTT